MFVKRATGNISVNGCLSFLFSPYTVDILTIGIAWWRHQMETFSPLLAFCVRTGEFPTQGQWRGALICARINGWVNTGEASDLRRHRVHYDVIVMAPEIHFYSTWIDGLFSLYTKHRMSVIFLLSVITNKLMWYFDTYLENVWENSTSIKFRTWMVWKRLRLTSPRLLILIFCPLYWRHNERRGVSKHQHLHCLFNRLCRLTSNKSPKPALPPVTGGFFSQRASNVESGSISWRHHVPSRTDPPHSILQQKLHITVRVHSI